MAEQRSETVRDTGDKLLDKPGGDILINVDAGDVEVDQQTVKEVCETVVADHAKLVDFQTREEQVSKSAIADNLEAVTGTNVKISYNIGSGFSIDISSDMVKAAKEVCETAMTLGALYVDYQLLRPLVNAAVRKALGGVLYRSTDERFLEVLWDYESGALKGHSQQEFLQARIKLKELKGEIENKAQVNEKKEVIEKRSRINITICENVKNTAMDDEESYMKQNMISKARSLALQFMSENPSCIRAIPYQSEDAKSLTMCLYMDANGKTIPNKITIAAEKLFENYQMEFVNLFQRPLNQIVIQPSQRKNSNKLDEISRKIEKNLSLFENRMNVTAVQASYKITDSIQQDIPCVTVYVINKGKIPAGETDIRKIKEQNGDLFNETEFDVAEGYYKMTNGSSLKGYASHLHGGVGIGVKGANSAGTLGGFLEDEDGKVYILSSKHILHPSDAAEDVIVQPSELDYENMHIEIEMELHRLTEKINRIRASKGESKSVLEEMERDRMEAEKTLDKIKSELPRRIGKYLCGVKDNHAFGDIKVYVDAAIATLDEDELSAMKDYKNWEVEENRCPLYGFETEKFCKWMDGYYHPPNGEIIDFQSFQEHVRTERSGEPSSLRFMKIGRTTGFTDKGFFEIPKERIHLHFMHSEDISGLVHIQNCFCEDCFQIEHPNHDPTLEADEGIKKCRRCEKELPNSGQIRSFWAQNCYLVGKERKPFSEEGDSGALVFDNQGRAWGLVFGYFANSTTNLSSVISPLWVVLDALKERSGRKELKLWTDPVMAEQRSGTFKDTGDILLEKPEGDILIHVDAGNVELDQQTVKEVCETVVTDHAKVVDFQTREGQVSESAIPGNMEAVNSTGFKVESILGGDFLTSISTDIVVVAKEVCSAAIKLGALCVGNQLLRPVIDAAVKKALGGERDDQEVKDIKPGSSHARLYCSTDERFLEVLTDYESGAMKRRLEEEFLQAGIKVKELKLEIEKKAEVDKIKEAIEKRSHIKRNLCEDVKNPAAGDAESDMKKEMISKARSLALQFMSENSSCIRAVPYESEDAKSLTMCLYMDTNGKRIPHTIYDAAQEIFKGYTIEVDDLYRRPLNKIVRQPPASQKQKPKDLADLSKTIEKNLHLFDNRMNVTAVQASYKVTDSIEQDTPCVTVFVLGKGKIPAGETDIRKIKEENSDIFDEVEFDVAEGYYKLTTGSSLKDHIWPLEGGVGIGVEGVDGAGTLGGFLEDEKGNVYILSNKHVLHPTDAAGEVIVQPSEDDHKAMLEEAKTNIKECTDKIENIPGSNSLKREEIEKINNSGCRSRFIKGMKEKIEQEKAKLTEIESQKPRQIGKYDYGFKENFAVGDHQVYVDAAIATLNESELNFMKCNQTNCCPVYGFGTNKYWKTRDCKPPNGDIIDFENFKKRIRYEDSELRFMKIGRTTEFTDEGFVDRPNEEMFLKYTHSKDIARLLDVEFLFCKNCKTSVRRESNPDPDKKQNTSNLCKKCGIDLDNPCEVQSVWARNCFVLRKPGECFSKEGDSGSLVFDNDGLAWGLVFGVFKNLSKDFVFSLISPLSVVLDALKKEAGMQELKLWCKPKNSTH